ncbi:MAG TPA: adenylate/guanylate cyclase domain-containing protein [Acidimicrobiales bacterium]|nr:adenylate/guanylate cyclase domain-containing protein [Acidimicrobiales bacterium]
MGVAATETYHVDIPLDRIVRVLRDPLALAAAVSNADAGLRLDAMLAGDTGVTIVFGDLEGFTPLAERIGDLAAARLLHGLDVMVREVVSAAGGQRLTSAGDGFMAVFPSPAAALRAALALQEHVDGDAPGARMRIGVHTGPVVGIRPADRLGDVVGLNVIVASRIADAARGGEVLVSAEVVDAVAGDVGFRFACHRSIVLKGLGGRHAVAELVWERPSGGQP